VRRQYARLIKRIGLGPQADALVEQHRRISGGTMPFASKPATRSLIRCLCASLNLARRRALATFAFMILPNANFERDPPASPIDVRSLG
jgi:hypothetical protein